MTVVCGVQSDGQDLDPSNSETGKGKGGKGKGRHNALPDLEDPMFLLNKMKNKKEAGLATSWMLRDGTQVRQCAHDLAADRIDRELQSTSCWLRSPGRMESPSSSSACRS